MRFMEERNTCYIERNLELEEVLVVVVVIAFVVVVVVAFVVWLVVVCISKYTNE